jgi:hypothetical protein
MKKVQRSSFKLNPITASILIAMSAQLAPNLANAGAGFGLTNKITAPAQTVPIATYYAHSPAGKVVALDPVTGLPTFDPLTNLPNKVDSGAPLRKFVDTLPGFGSVKANNLGQYIPVAVPEKWTDAAGNATDDYYEIAAVEYSEKMHSDLPKATHLRGYVQLMTAGLAAKGVVGQSYTTLDGQVLSVVDLPHHLGPVINATSGTAVRIKFTNYLPVGAGGNLFLPVDHSLTGAGLGVTTTLGPDATGKLPGARGYVNTFTTMQYTENRAEIHLVGGEAPWVSAGSPHQWVAPAGEAAAYAAGLGKGVSNKDVPDMAAAGNGSTTLYFPNTQSARFTFFQDRTSGLTRLNNYAGLEAGYTVTDAAEAALVASGAIPADQIPLIIEDKTFVPANVAQQDAKWDAIHWGAAGDLWFPHVYETNQDPNAVSGLNSVGRWDFGPWFWPIFAATAALPSGKYGDASFVPESYQDTPVINGTAYPSLTVDPKAYRFRIMNVSNDRFFNLGLYKAKPDSVVDAAGNTVYAAPQLDSNGNPMFDAAGKPLFFSGTEVNMLPAVADVTGAPPNPTSTTGLAYDVGCLCQYPNLQPLLNYSFSGPTRAWPVDNRIGGAPDPASVGPDFIAIGNDGGFLPHAVDIPSQPVTYEANRRSVTVTNVYGYGLLVGPSERADAIVDFSPYAGQTLIVYNDAPTPFPFDDQRDDYFSGDPDLTGQGGTYTTKPGYGPNTRTIMQIKVNAALPLNAPITAYTQANLPAGGVLGVTPSPLDTALAAAYKASQIAPIVPESIYNAAFGTTDTDNYGHVATGSLAQPTLDFTTSGNNGSVASVNLIASGGVGNGSGTNYDPLNPPTVVFSNGSCLPALGVSASATATVDAVTHQVSAVTMVANGSGYTCAPQILFNSAVGIGAQAAAQMTSGTQKILAQTKAEQELFDAAGRYNSTGGVEIPLTSGTTQTTVPLNYTDSPTEFVGDTETQVWKLVDNGFWSNSMHFDMVDVQLINRVGWDGTVKAPANNETGWKDTLRLNPLEDVIVAMRAKHPQVPFGQPASHRAQDPSIQVGAAAAKLPVPVAPYTASTSQLPFLADPAIVSPQGASLLTTTVNTNVVVDNTKAGNIASPLGYDNEFVWGTAVLGHAEDDFMRPVVYHPTVTVPGSPFITSGTAGALVWTDPTPAGVAATLGNPANEVGVNVMRATYTVDNGLGKFAAIASSLPANTVSYTDATQVAGTDYAYEVAAYNNAGTTTSAAYLVLSPTVAPVVAITAPVAPGSVTLSWPTVTGATGYLVSMTTNGVTTTYTTNRSTSTPTAAQLQHGYSYSITVTAQKSATVGGVTTTVNSLASNAVTANLTAFPVTPTAPTATNVAATTLTLNWAPVLGAATYTVQRATNSNFNGTVTTIATGVAATTQALTGLTANTTYYFRVVAVNANSVNGPASAAVTTLAATPGVPTGLASSAVTSTGYTLGWTAPTAAATTGYNVLLNGVVVSANQAARTYVVTGANPNTAYGPYTVQACSNAGTTCSAASATPVSVTTLPLAPTAPTAPTASALAATTLTLTWTPVTGATSYTVQRATNAAFTTGVATAAGTFTGASLAVTGLAGNTTYYFRVTAVNAGGPSAAGTVSAAVLTAPAVPTATAANGTTGGTITGGLNFTVVTGLTYKLNWTGPSPATTTGSAAVTTSGQQVTFATAGTYSMTVTATNASGSATSAAFNVTVR